MARLLLPPAIHSPAESRFRRAIDLPRRTKRDLSAVAGCDKLRSLDSESLSRLKILGKLLSSSIKSSSESTDKTRSFRPAAIKLA